MASYTKAQLVSHIADNANLKRADAEAALAAALEGISGALSNGDKVTLVGFGTFLVKSRAERKGVNPATGKAMTIPASTTVGFRPGSALRDSVG